MSRGLAGCPLADAVAVAAEVFLDRIGFLCVADGDVDQGLPAWLRCRLWSGDAGNSESKGRSGVAANAIGKGFGHFSGDGAVFGDQLRGNAGEEVFNPFE